MNRQEKIDAIYEKIADKTLSFGCKIIVKNKYGDEIDFVVEKLLDSSDGVQARYCGYLMKKHIEKIIGHPVMIGDVMDYLWKKENTLSNDGIFTPEVFQLLEGNGGFGDFYWQEKRKPIEEQSDECLDFVFDLIFN